MNLKAAGLRALVIGGGHVALRKVKKLIAEGADVTILAPEVVSDIEALSEAKKVHWEKHLFRGDDLSSYGLIVTACGVRKWQKRCSRHRRRAISFIMLQIFLRWGIAHCRLLLMQGGSRSPFLRMAARLRWRGI